MIYLWLTAIKIEKKETDCSGKKPKYYFYSMKTHSALLDKLHNPIHSSWNSFLTKEISEILNCFDEGPGKDNYTPTSERILHFLTTSLDEAKVIILGQDPYPQSGVATGRAFEVGTLTSWNSKFRNISLKNIVRLLYKTYAGEIKTYREILTLLPNQLNLFQPNQFNLLPPNQLFNHWEQQGVLLLNTAFTCKIGEPGSHSAFWAPFTRLLLEYINKERPDLIWILWGNHALEITAGLKLNNAYQTFHPMMCYDRPERKSDFLFGKTNPFLELKSRIDWTGYSFSRR